MSSVSSSPKTVEEIFKDYSARRSGIVRALTHGTSFDFFPFYFFSNFWNLSKN